MYLCVCVFFQDEEDVELPVRPRRSPLNGLCCLTFFLVVFMSGLVLASIYVYRCYFIPHVRGAGGAGQSVCGDLTDAFIHS